MTEARSPLAGRRIVVAVTGSIAAYKAVALVRLLAERGAAVDVAMTPAATAFVTPLTFASLTHRPVVHDVMALDADQQIAHVELAEGADAIVIAPATANVIAELAAGLAVTASPAPAERRSWSRPPWTPGCGPTRRPSATSRRCAGSATTSSSRRSERWPAGSPASGASPAREKRLSTASTICGGSARRPTPVSPLANAPTSGSTM